MSSSPAEHHGLPRLPASLRAAFQIIVPPAFAKAFHLLKEEAHRQNIYNQPDKRPVNPALLYELGERANLTGIARELARNWGEDDTDGPLQGFDRLRSWPDATNRGPHTLRLTLGVVRPRNFVLRLLPLDGHEQIRIFDQNNRLVLSSDEKFIRPGDWLDHLMIEYARFRQWRRDNETLLQGKPAAPARELIPSPD